MTEPDTEALLCDICVHVRSNPVGQKGSKSNIPKFVAREELQPPQLDGAPSLSWCQQCCQQTGHGISHPCNPASRKRNLVKLIDEQNQNDKEAILGTSLLNLSKAQKTSGKKVELSSVGGNHKKINVALEKDLNRSRMLK